jgi:hypothetical protein
MTQNNSHKKQARDLQARTGTPHTCALREVTAMISGASGTEDRPIEPLLAMLLPPLADSPDGSGREPLRPLRFGRSSDGATLAPNLNDAHAAGNGPHALLVGTTSAGKSTLLHTLAYGLCAQHSPGSVRMIVVAATTYRRRRPILPITPTRQPFPVLTRLRRRFAPRRASTRYHLTWW